MSWEGPGMEGVRQNPNPQKVLVPIRPDTLRWALEWSRLGVDQAARKVGVEEEKLRAWLKGEAKPTYAQARKLAKALNLGLPKLLVPPPEEGPELPVRDFRRGPNWGGRPSPELLEALYDALRKVDWWRERRKEPLPFVGSGKGKLPEEVALDLSKRLSLVDLPKAPVGEFLRRMVERVEALGVLVLRGGHVGTNTRRVYEPREFSGFALVDPVAPVVFVNARDYPRRQVFTLAHELAHIWRGEGGLDGALEEELPHEEMEAWADKVAAALLMPEGAFREAWPSNLAPLEAARETSKRFGTSTLATLRRAWSLGLIAQEAFLEALEELKKGEPPLPRGSGGDFWRTLEAQNSPTFVRELKRAAEEGELDAKEVAHLLNVSLRTAWDFLSRGHGERVSP